MSITDELREWYKERLFMANGWQEIHDIADRIDAEHKRLMRERRRSCVFYDAERNYCKVHDEGDMAELGYVRLPVDADGVPIHVGDEMCGYGWPNGGVYCRAIVNEVTILVGPQDGAYRGWLMWAANECRHYHAPTVEDVLTEMFAKAIERGELTNGAAQTIAEYAAKLRLAGSDAE